MTLQSELVAAIERGDPDGVVRLLEAASDDDRREAAGFLVDYLPPRASSGPHRGTITTAQFLALGLANLGTLALAALKKRPGSGFHGDRRFLQVLALRPERFRTAYAKWLLGTNDRAIRRWDDVRAAERSGLVERTGGQHYWAGLVESFSVGWQNPRTPKTERIDAQARKISRHFVNDAEFIDEVWVLFGDERGVRKMHADPMRTAGWAAAVCRLVADGHLDRGEAINGALRGHLLGIKPSATRVFGLLLDGLAPGDKEIAERATTVLRLVDSDLPSGHKRGLALAARLIDTPTLDAAALANALRSPLAATQKANAATALTLLDRIVAVDGPAALRTAATALGHPGTDIQKRAVALLRRHRNHIEADPDLAAEVLAWVDLASPTLAEELANLTGVTDDGPFDDSDPFAPLIDRAVHLSERSRRVFEIGDATAAAQAGIMPRPITFDPWDPPWLTEERRFEAIDSFDELLTVLPAAMASSDPYLLEQGLDGLSRMCDGVPDPGIARALEKQALKDVWNKDVVLVVGVAHRSFAGSVRAWISGTRPQTLEFLDGDARDGDVLGMLIPPVIDEQRRYLAIDPDGGTSGVSLMQLHVARCWEVARRAAQGDPRPLLATPTHGWWIDPAAFAARLEAYIDAGVAPGRFDAVVALLRLWPVADQGLVAALAALPSDVGRAAARVLGADVAVTDPGLDRAAHRRRGAIGDIRFVPSSYATDGVQLRFDIDIETAPFRRDDPIGAVVPVMTEHERFSRFRWPLRDGEILGFEGAIRWACTTTPRQPDFIAAALAVAVAHDLDGDRSAPRLHDAVATFLDPDVPFGNAAHTLVTTSLGSKSSRIAGAAIDVAVAATHDGRLDPQRFGERLARLVDGGLLPVNRCGPNLHEVGRASALAAEHVRRALVTAFGAFHQMPRRPLPLLEPLAELGAGLGRGVDDGTARANLTALTAGSSKGAKLARLVLDLPTEWPGAAPEAAALSARIDRAARWDAAAAVEESRHI